VSTTSTLTLPSVSLNTAIAANVTVTDAQDNGYLTAFPYGVSSPPNTSLLNFGAGETIANATMSGTGTAATPGAGGMYLYNASSGFVDVIVDVFGYYN
jgi:hypothetical protein